MKVRIQQAAQLERSGIPALFFDFAHSDNTFNDPIHRFIGNGLQILGNEASSTQVNQKFVFNKLYQICCLECLLRSRPTQIVYNLMIARGMSVCHLSRFGLRFQKKLYK